MHPRLPLLLLLTACACAVLGVAGGSSGLGVAAAEAASPRSTFIAGLRGGPIIGLSDNRPETMTDRRFRASGIKRIRVLVPFDDVARGGSRRQTQDAWFHTAQANGIEPLVSFYRSLRSRRWLPTTRQFLYHFRRFRQRYPWVRQFSTWNEANFPAAQPTGRNPRRTAQFYKLLRRECSGGRCTDTTGRPGHHGYLWLTHGLGAAYRAPSPM